ncbi:MAG: hypothetical protein WBB25_09125 [Sulfitobacter sp.]
MENKKILMGGGAAVVVLLLVALIFGGGDDGDDKIKEMISGTLAPVSDTVDALGGQVGEIQTAVDAQIAEITEGFEAQIAGLQETIDTLTAQAENAVSSDDLAAMQAQIDELPSAAPQAAPVAAASDASPGETIALSDGALRVFVSRLTEGAARLSVGQDMFTMRTGTSRTVQGAQDTCRLTLASVGAGASLTATCGADMPAAKGLSVGQTAMLAEGALRVFVSKVRDHDARLSVGQTMYDLAPGESVATRVGDTSCTATLDSVDRGLVQVSGGC